VKQVADQLQVCTKTVRRLISKHGVPVVTVGCQTRVPAQHLALFLQKKW
jgi:excisionase family DNA binding protein